MNMSTAAATAAPKAMRRNENPVVAMLTLSKIET
jgi:hypothetical protein